eukprot:TRINITY_DN1532_c0_g1_i1.p2 TRINITY_DN1532_c0_g1~~TRINITY_DN1532_c0_g1_i1.p2  ORF type:complete len:124 (+),score=44.92 TRINITY_DN1532_c0_g1_i1:100-471(+)
MADDLFSMVAMMIDEELSTMKSKYKLDDTIIEQLAEQMKKRSATFTEDMKSIQGVLEGSPNPREQLKVAIIEMKDGTFDQGVLPEGSRRRSRSRSRGRPAKAKTTSNQSKAPPRAMTLLERFG